MARMTPGGPGLRYDAFGRARPVCGCGRPRAKGAVAVEGGAAPAVETQALTRRFGPRVACNEITLAVPRGGIFALLGRNGAGKSTFVKMLVGLIRPSSGAARVLGHPAGSIAARRRFGFLPEHFRYPEWATATEVLAFHAALADLAPERRHGRIAAVLDLVGLADDAGRVVGGFSKGMQQRLGIACAVLDDPPLVFLDEPTSALDPVGRREVRELLVRLRGDGKTVFLNTHLLSEVELVADRVAVIRAGCLVASGSVAEFRQSTVEAEVRLAAADDAAIASLAACGAILERTPEPGGLVAVRLALADGVGLPAVAAAVVGAEGRLYGLAARRRSLEDVFIALVAGDPGEAT